VSDEGDERGKEQQEGVAAPGIVGGRQPPLCHITYFDTTNYPTKLYYTKKLNLLDENRVKLGVRICIFAYLPCLGALDSSPW